jgi:exosortase
MAVIYGPVFYQLYQSRWETIDYTHAYFILPVSLWIAWQKRNILKDLFIRNKPQPSDMVGLAVAVFGLMMFVLGWRQEYLFISSLSLIPVLWGSIRYLYGSAVVKSLAFPIFYLFFLIPPPLGVLDKLTLPMRYGISEATGNILHWLGYPIQRSGLLLTIDGNDIFMGAPCSGFRSLITMLALAAGYVYFKKGDFRKKLILVFSGVPFALLGNLVRVMTLCLVTFYLGKEAAEGFFHYFSGALIFLIMIICLMGLEYVLDRPLKSRSNV